MSSLIRSCEFYILSKNTMIEWENYLSRQLHKNPWYVHDNHYQCITWALIFNRLRRPFIVFTGRWFSYLHPTLVYKPQVIFKCILLPPAAPNPVRVEGGIRPRRPGRRAPPREHNVYLYQANVGGHGRRRPSSWRPAGPLQGLGILLSCCWAHASNVASTESLPWTAPENVRYL